MKCLALTSLLLVGCASDSGPVYMTKEIRFTPTGNAVIYECTDPCLPLESFDQVLPASLVQH